MSEDYVEAARGKAGSIIEKTIKILSKHSLCDHCLGRLFAKLGRGLGNDERGYVLKTLASMTLPLDKNSGYRNFLKKLAENAGGPIARLYKAVYGEDVEVKNCFLCGGKISRKYFNELADKIAGLLREYNATSFLVGVSLDYDTFMKELEIVREAGIEYSESIKNEIKREVGKIVRDKTGIEPDFTKPDVIAIIDYATDNIKLIVNPILLMGRYWKKARNISHTIWSVEGAKKYPYSIEEFLNDILSPLYESERVILHASGREDVDARMLGTGRPMVVEITSPKLRLVDNSLVNEILKTRIIDAEILGDASRETIKLLKTDLSKKEKIYKVLVLTEKPVNREKLRELEEFFKDKLVRQLTPLRILRRKKERERIRRVYEVKTRKISERIFEALVKSEGGLYIKELVSGDQGRTEPSFTSVLGVQAYCIELDVIGVEVYLPRIQKPLN